MTFQRSRRALAALVLLLAACGGEPPVHETGVKVLLIGIDGGSFSVLDPLVQAGELPNFERLLSRGARGPLLSEKPIASPPIWTTIATGTGRGEHGIKGFTRKKPEGGVELVNSRMRERLAIWDMASSAGREVGIVGWWASWPAEPVRGFLVSDRGTRSRWSEWADGTQEAHVTFPPELFSELTGHIVDPMEGAVDRLERLVSLSEVERQAVEAARKPVRGHALSVVKFGFANQLSYEGIFEAMLDRGQPDLGAVFLIAADPVSHTFWHHYEPEAFGLERTADRERLGDAIPAIYRHNDAYLGRLLDRIDDDTVVLIVSDHGFQAAGVLPKPASEEQQAEIFGDTGAAPGADPDVVAVGQSGKHHIEGILIASGGPILPGEVRNATIYDVAPTILALLGLPVGEDLGGKVLEDMIDPAFLQRFPVRTIPSWEHRIDRQALKVEVDREVGEKEALEMLKSLGYVQ